MRFVPDVTPSSSPPSKRPDDSKTATLQQAPVAKAADAVLRIGRMEAANRAVTWVAPNTDIKDAVTRMMISDFSQLPVMQNERNLKGAVSWQSIARATYRGKKVTTVDECMDENVGEVLADASLLEVIPRIVSSGYVLVRATDKRVQGIVTTADLSDQFQRLSEPFLLLGEIENQLRFYVARSFSVDELQQAKDPADEKRKIEDVHDLSFGEYVRLLEPGGNFEQLSLGLHAKPFLASMREVAAIRNDVMHFDPDGVTEKELAAGRSFAGFLRELAL